MADLIAVEPARRWAQEAGAEVYTERIPVDPRIVDQIVRSPRMSSEQGANFMQKWGGPKGYMMAARMSGSEREVLKAVLEGYRTEEEIGVVTGLATVEIRSSLKELGKKNLVKETLSAVA